jgi:hypothetical protein
MLIFIKNFFYRRPGLGFLLFLPAPEIHKLTPKKEKRNKKNEILALKIINERETNTFKHKNFMRVIFSHLHTHNIPIGIDCT